MDDNELVYGDHVECGNSFKHDGVVIRKSDDYYGILTIGGGVEEGYFRDIKKLELTDVEKLRRLLETSQYYAQHSSHCAARTGEQCNCGYEQFMHLVGRALGDIEW